MTVHKEAIAKIRQLSEPLVQQVNDFIEFLLMRNDNKRAALWMQFNEALEIAESNFTEYLPNLKDYEERFARGEIQWRNAFNQFLERTQHAIINYLWERLRYAHQ
jgi:hypothetical protein